MQELDAVAFIEEGTTKVVWATPIEAEQIEPASFRLTAHLVQAWVDKAFDVRLTVVGRHLFAAAITTDSSKGRIDWRTDYDSLRYAPIAPPKPVERGIQSFMTRLGLTFAAMDFSVDHDGRWWFLEANPNGQWLWIEHETGLPIAGALAEVLMKG